MNEMYKYLLDHNYISDNKKINKQKELSQDRAECIANKYNNLANQELKDQLKQRNEVIDEIVKLIKTLNK